MENISITAVKYAESWLGDRAIFEGSVSNAKSPISFTIFLIETQGRRILADAGCDSMGPHWDMRYFLSPDKVLEREGIAPDSITDIIITHAHHDHIQAVKYFSNAVIWIQKDELKNMRVHYIPEGFRVNTFDDEFELCKGVKVIRIGGHTVGSCIVEVDAGGKKYVITGDEVYSPKCLELKIAAGAPYSRENSRRFVEEYSKDCYTPLVSHDPAFIPGRNGIVRIV